MEKIQFFSIDSGRAFSLYPTPAAPTMLISGIPMHRIKDTDPWSDTLTKVRALGPVRGRVLDTSLGLGYTAIALARELAARDHRFVMPNQYANEANPRAHETTTGPEILADCPEVDVFVAGLGDAVRVNKSGCLAQCGHGPMLAVALAWPTTNCSKFPPVALVIVAVRLTRSAAENPAGDVDSSGSAGSSWKAAWRRSSSRGRACASTGR